MVHIGREKFKKFPGLRRSWRIPAPDFYVGVSGLLEAKVSRTILLSLGASLIIDQT